MKGRLLSGVAAVAFGMGMVATGPALADGSVTDWDWYKNKYQNVDINMWVWSFFDPTGETEVRRPSLHRRRQGVRQLQGLCSAAVGRSAWDGELIRGRGFDLEYGISPPSLLGDADGSPATRCASVSGD